MSIKNRAELIDKVAECAERIMSGSISAANEVEILPDLINFLNERLPNDYNRERNVTLTKENIALREEYTKLKEIYKKDTEQTKKKAYVQIQPDLSELTEVKRLVDELRESLEKANCLLGQLANREEVSLQINLVIDKN